MFVVLIASIWSTTACNSSVDRLSGLIVDTDSAEASEDGSECFPYKDLSSALSNLNSGGGGKIEISRCNSLMNLGPIDLTEAAEVSGLDCEVQVSGLVKVKAALSLKGLVLTGSDQGFEVTSELSLRECKVTFNGAVFINLKEGTLNFAYSEFSDSSSSFIEANNNGIFINVSNSSFSKISAVLFWKFAADSGAASSVTFDASTFTSIPGTLLSIDIAVSLTTGQTLTISGCSFTDVGLVGNIVARSLTTTVRDCTFIDSRFLVLSQFDSSTSLESSKITGPSSNFFIISPLLGQINIAKTEVISMTDGTFLKVINSPNNVAGCLIQLEDVKLSNIIHKTISDNIINILYSPIQIRRLITSNTLSNAGKK